MLSKKASSLSFYRPDKRFIVVENEQPVTLSGLIKPLQPAMSVPGKFQKEFSFMEAVGYTCPA